MSEFTEMEISENSENDNNGPKTEREVNAKAGLVPTFWPRLLEVRDYMSKKVTDNSTPLEIGTPDEEDLS